MIKKKLDHKIDNEIRTWDINIPINVLSELKKTIKSKWINTGPKELAGVGDNKGFEQPTENELINKPGYGAKKKLGGIMRKGGQVRKKRKK